MTLQSLNGVRGYWGGPWVFVSEPLRTATMDYLATRGVYLNRNGGLSAPRFLHELSGRHTVMDRDHVALVIQSLANRLGSGRDGGIAPARCLQCYCAPVLETRRGALRASPTSGLRPLAVVRCVFIMQGGGVRSHFCSSHSGPSLKVARSKSQSASWVKVSMGCYHYPKRRSTTTTTPSCTSTTWKIHTEKKLRSAFRQFHVIPKEVDDFAHYVAARAIVEQLEYLVS